MKNIARLVTLVAVSVLAMPGVANAQDTAACYDAAAPLTVEEQRLDDTLVPGGPAVGPQLVKLAGFDDDVERATARLCRTFTHLQAKVFVAKTGVELWRAAVARAQGAPQAHDVYDDRPLYWARLSITKALRQWKPRFGLDAGERAKLVQSFDWASRGVDDVRFKPGVKRVLLTGFDPFQLNGPTVRRSNPSGAAALQLDGRVLDTPQGRIVVEAAMLPVTWGGFDEGIVEQFFGGALKHKPDAFVTVSQGRSNFDIERWAGRWRGGSPDNNDIRTVGSVPNAAGWPQPTNEFIETTLPHEKMIAAGTGPYKVALNRMFCEFEGHPTSSVWTCRTDEPTPGRFAFTGGGGNYLSNESMYRANRLRVGLGLTKVQGGHLHTPVLSQPADPAVITDAAFELERRNIANQVVALVSSM